MELSGKSMDSRSFWFVHRLFSSWLPHDASLDTPHDLCMKNDMKDMKQSECRSRMGNDV